MAGPAADRVSAAQIAASAFAPVAATVATVRIPGAVLGVLAGGERAVLTTGWAAVVPDQPAMTRETWFDLASLTKPIFTTPTVLRLMEQETLALDDRLTWAIPDLRQYDMAAPERRLTFGQCLSHATHLPAVEPLYTYGQDPATLRAFVLQREWRTGPAVYSDINFILLGIAIERLDGRPLRDQPVAPGLSWAPDPALCAATEACTWRGRVLRGEVHDENAAALGGAAGHAGLFGTADGVLDFAAGLLEATPPDAPIRTPAGPTRTFGWERRYPGWSGGDACSEQTIGHTGFTGTGLWIDFERKLAWTLLTNRVHPTRHVETGIQALRREVGRLVASHSGG